MSDATEWLISKNRFSQIKFKNATVLSVASGKGGVGKTTLTLKMAQELTSQGLKVLVIDCDFNLSNTSVKLGVRPRKTLIDFVKNDCQVNELIHQSSVSDIIFSGNGEIEFYKDPIAQYHQSVIDILQKIVFQYDYILLDCPAGCSQETLNLCAYADERVFLVTPDKSSITDSYSMIKLLNQLYGVKHSYCILNKIQGDVQYKKISHSLKNTAEKFLTADISILGGIEHLTGIIEEIDEKILNGKVFSLQKNMQKMIKTITDESREQGIRMNSLPNHHQQRVTIPVMTS